MLINLGWTFIPLIFKLPKARRSNLGDAALKVNLPPIDLNSAAPKDFQEIRGLVKC